MQPKVSVCIPAYNRKDMLRATLWSVLRQSYRNVEVIVSDNASQEDLEAVVVAADDPRVRYIRQEENIGGPGNFRYLQTVATGDYVLFLCSDDLLAPECIAKTVAALESNPQRGGAVYMAAHYSKDGFQFLSRMPERDYATAAEYSADRAVRDFSFASPSLCIYRRAAFDRLGGWSKQLLAVIDYDMYARMTRGGGGLLYLHEVLAIMRLHENRDSNTAALHWNFYHDVMLMSGQPEYPWGNAYRSKAMMEQLLWDLRLRRSPMRTLGHAYDTKAFPAVLLYLPWEMLRRLGRRLRAILSKKEQAHVNTLPLSRLPDHFDVEAFDRFWRASELVRTAA